MWLLANRECRLVAVYENEGESASPVRKRELPAIFQLERECGVFGFMVFVFLHIVRKLYL